MANDERFMKVYYEAKKRAYESRRFPVELGSNMEKFLSGYADKMKKSDDDSVESKKNVSGSRDGIESNVSADASANESVAVEGSVSRKRKREGYTAMLDWMHKVAKDPADPAIGEMPERDKWKDYGADVQWKQTILIRDAMMLESNVDARSQMLVWQRMQKMHPVMYDDHGGGSPGLRTSQRIATVRDNPRNVRGAGTPGSSSSAQNNNCADIYSDSYSKRMEIPVGSPFQAELPQFVGVAEYQSDSKWLGTRVWPLDKGEQIRSLIERDPMGKGRQESCGCQFQGSLECVRFHIRERRNKVKVELGSAFYLWKFDRMGEDVALTWSKEDKAKFQDIVQKNQVSNGKYFWDELFKVFAHKGREALVSYYFNSFLLRRRADQNRNKTDKINSDDDESEYGPTADRFGHRAAFSPGSIFRSPKKPNQGRR